MASIDKRGRTWRARVRLQGFPTKTRSFDTRSEAEKWARREENALLAGVESVPDLSTEMTLAEALDKYKEKETVKKKGIVQESRRIEAWKKHPLAALKLSLLRPQHFADYRDTRLTSVAKNTVRLDLAVISNLFNIAKAEWGMPYLENPVSMRGLTDEKGRDRRLDAKERARFGGELTRCSNELVVLTVLFAMYTAARQGEILRLRRDDVNLRKRSVLFRNTKNDDDRTVPLTKEATEILRGVLDSHEHARVFPITRNVLVNAWRRIRESGGIKNFRFHDLRHEATSQFFERGLGVMEVQRITGHKTLKMLLRYTHLNVDHIVNRLDETEGKNDPQMRIAAGPTYLGIKAEGEAPRGATVIPFRRRGTK